MMERGVYEINRFDLPELNKCICNYCGNEMIVDKEENNTNINNGFEFGYQSELGRAKAQADIKAEEERVAKLEEERQKAAQKAKAEINAQNFGKAFSGCCISFFIVVGILALLFLGGCAAIINSVNDTSSSSSVKHKTSSSIYKSNNSSSIKSDLTNEERERARKAGASIANKLNDFMGD